MTQRRVPGIRGWSIVLTSFLLVGCGGGDMSDLRTYVEKIKQRPPSPITPLPEIQPIDTHIYDPFGRRDPFQMETPGSITAAVEDGLAPDPSRPKEELESFPLDSLEMVGTLAQDDQLWGLVRTRVGMVYRVQVGNYLGMNNGQIIEISDQAIRLTEIVPEGVGSWRERPAQLALVSREKRGQRR